MSDGGTIRSGNIIEILVSNGSEYFRQIYYGGAPGGDGAGIPTQGGSSLPVSYVPGSSGASAAGTVPFTDVAVSDYYYDSVVWAYNSSPQITDGTSASTFSPRAVCTRGQVVTFLWRASGCPEPEGASVPFRDVTEKDYFYKPVLWAVSKGITDGTSPETFSPSAACANSHILTFIHRAMGEPGKTGEGSWWSDAYDWALREGLLAGTYTGTFDINADCPRCNVIEYLYRYLAMSGDTAL
ncbi:MAG: S-layer homology domain-containing protein [Firmicutes bacterium]|nr:S-layer homology domain-containing protein [Bacillota bacterium]